MDIRITMIDTIEDKEIYVIDPSEEVADDDTLRSHRKLKKLLFDHYHYFLRADDPLHPYRWILYRSTI